MEAQETAHAAVEQAAEAAQKRSTRPHVAMEQRG